MSAKPIERIRYSHDAMIDLIIAQPSISQNQLAVQFGYTPAWISTIMSSDAFKARLAARREELVDPQLVITLEERFRAIAERSAEVLMEKLSVPAPFIPDAVALKAAEFGAKALGVGGFSSAPPRPTEPSPDHLEAIAERLVFLQRRARETLVEGITVEVRSADG